MHRPGAAASSPLGTCLPVLLLSVHFSTPPHLLLIRQLGAPSSVAVVAAATEAHAAYSGRASRGAQFVAALGLDTRQWRYVDVCSFDAELLAAMVPQPVAALLLLFPVTDSYEAAAEEERARLEREPQQISDQVYFIRQTIANACGTIGVLHSILNNCHLLGVTSGPLSEFYARTRTMSPTERCAALMRYDSIARAHDEYARQGQTQAPPLEADVNLHYVCFVCVDGSLYELDGRKPAPVRHGETAPERLLLDAARAATDFIQRDADNLRFTAIALARADE